MTDKEIEKMLSEIVEKLDYDIYKEIFLYQERSILDLVLIVKKYLGKNNAL